MGKKRIDQDIFFTLKDEVTGKSVKCRLWLDTTYPGPEDMFVITSVEPVDRMTAELATQNICHMLYERYSDLYEEFDTPNEMRITVLAESPEGGIGVTGGIFASLPDWKGDNFDFIGAAGLVNLLNDLKKTEPGIEFLRGDGTKIEIPSLNRC